MEKPQAVLKRIGIDEEFKIIHLNKNLITVGRDVDQDYRINSLRFSRKHALFKLEDNQWNVVDLNSINGVCINSKRIVAGSSNVINCGEIIRFGPEHIKGEFEYVFMCGDESQCVHRDSSVVKNDKKEKTKSSESKKNEVQIEFINSDKLQEIELNEAVIEARKKTKGSKNAKSIAKSNNRKIDKQQNKKIQSEKEMTELLFGEENMETTESSAKEHLKDEDFQSKALDFNSIVESELECAICTELFINAVTLNCSHSFCKYCLDSWRSKRRSTCPTCLAELKTESRSLVLDSFIERITDSWPLDKRKTREKIVAERTQSNNKKQKCHDTRSSRQLRTSCHCGKGRPHAKSRCPTRRKRRTERNAY